MSTIQTRPMYALMAALPVALALRGFFKLVTKIKQWRRTTNLLLKLPHAKIPVEEEGNFLAQVQHFMPKEENLDFEKRIQKHNMIGLQKMAESVGTKVVNFWYLPPKYTLVPWSSVLITDLGLVKDLLSTKNMPFIEKSILYKTAADLNRESLVAVEGRQWEIQRKILEKSFLKTTLVNQFDSILDTAKTLCKRYETLLERAGSKTIEVDVRSEANNFALDSLGKVSFGYDFKTIGCLEGERAPLAQAFHTLLSTMTEWIRNPMLYITKDFLPTKMNRNYKRSLQFLDNVVLDIIASRKKVLSDKNENALDAMLRSVMIDGKQMSLTEREILYNIKNNMFAGMDTTGATLSWSLYLLSKFPKFAEEIRAEGEKLYGSNLERLDIENLEECDSLNKFVMETLRLYPPAAFERYIKEDIYLGEYLIPKGATVQIAPFISQRDPKKFKNPDEVDLSRWNDFLHTGKEKLSLQSAIARAAKSELMVPFATGKRVCVGRSLALIELRVGLLYLLKDFKLTLPEKQPDGFQEYPYSGITLGPNNVHVCIGKCQ